MPNLFYEIDVFLLSALCVFIQLESYQSVGKFINNLNE